MVVLFACNRDSYKNPYVRTLADGLQQVGCEVICSINEFWHPTREYSIVHIQWPDLLPLTPWDDCKNIEKRIGEYKKHGTKVVATCHNLLPHYSSVTAVLKSYEIVYKNADCIIHLGETSIEMLKTQLPMMNAKHVVIPHHTYDTIYKNVSKNESRKELGVPQDSKCVMSFGTFRDDEEREIVLSLRKRLPKEYVFLMPGFFRDAIIRKNVLLGVKNIFKTIKYSCVAKKNNIVMNHRYVPDEVLPYYLAAADVVLIQRKKILNSGNVSLAMLFGLPIVGPNVGNVGGILQETHNYVFDVNNMTNLSDLVEAAMHDNELGKKNKVYADEKLKTRIVAKQHFDLYKSILEDSNEN